MVGRRLLPLFLLLAVVLAVPAGAGAVLGGENGRIVFISGRDADNDNFARIHFLPVPSSTGGGTVSPPIAALGNQQYRHPTWSPDRTMIAYARGVADSSPLTQNFDIYMLDIASGMETAITNTSDSLSADRPAWSPDGTRIAYEHQPTDGSAERDIRVYTIATGANLDLTSGAPVEHKPAWRPDSQEIWYGMGDIATAASGIYREPAGGGMVAPVLDQGGVSEFQPAISPDGTQYCFTIGDFGSNANVYVGTVGSATQIFLANEVGVGEYNCTWSPDGFMVTYVRGTFSTGELVMERADNSSVFIVQLAQDPGGDNFDGNPDWAPDGRPTCEPASAATLSGAAVPVTLRCTDQGPAYEQSPVNISVQNQPANGTATDNVGVSPHTVTYTPNAGFVGTDTFPFHSFDDLGFGGGSTATVRVLARGNCANLQTGTAGPNTLNGTFAGDRLRGLRGNDRLNGLAGNDCLDGGRGNDRLNGAAGNDVLVGGPGRNTYAAGAGNDTVRARNGRRETVNCGKGRRDRAVVDRSDRVRGCERVTRRR